MTTEETPPENDPGVVDDAGSTTVQPANLVSAVSTSCSSTTSSSSSIWDTLNEDEKRMARLRNRLEAMRCANTTASLVSRKSDDTVNRHLPSDVSMGSNYSTLDNISTSSPIPNQEEARRWTHQNRLAYTDSTTNRPVMKGHGGIPNNGYSNAPTSNININIHDNSNASTSSHTAATIEGQSSAPSATVTPGSNSSTRSPNVPIAMPNTTTIPSPDSIVSPEAALAALELRVLQEGRKNKLRRRDVGRGLSISSITPSSPHSIRRQHQQQHTPSETTCDMTQLQPIIQPNLPQGRPRRQRSPMPALPGSDVYRQKITLSSMEEKQLVDGSGQMSQLLPPRHTPGEGRRREQDVNQHRVGAFSMEGRGTQQPQQQQLDSTAALESSSRQPPRSLSITSIVPVAAMVVEDLDMEELTAKEEQLREQEKELAAKMARLQAWEEELQRQKDDLELRERSVYIGPFCATPAIVQAEIVEGKDLPPRSIFASLRHSLPSGSERSDHDVTTVASCTDFVGEDQIDFTVSTTNEEMRWEEAMADLGGGPLRFYPRGERSIEEQVHYLPTPDKRAFNNLKQSWQDYQIKLRAIGAMNRSFDMPPLWHLRYLRFTSKPCGSFVEERAFQSEKKLKQRFLSLNVFTLQHQLKSKTLFPVPGLKTKGGHPMFYMRPSRYVPGKTTTKAVIDNQCYVMNTMLETELAQQEGIGFIACMDDWKMRNFEINYCYQFMMALQGVMVPVKTQLFLIVNPPAWFGIIWRLMKPMLAPSFRKRVKICNESKIAKYLAPDFAAYLPDDMSTGRVPTDAIVSDFISYRQYVESSLPQNAFPGSEDGQSTSYQSHDMPLDEQRMDQFGNWNEGDSTVSRDRAVIAVARVPRIGTDYSAASVGDSTGVGYSFQYDDDDDDLASIDAHIDDDHLSDDEDMKNAACIDLTSGTSTSA